MASISFIGYEEGRNLKEMLQQFYGNAQEHEIVLSKQNRPHYITDGEVYPFFLAEKLEDNFRVLVQELEDSDFTVICSEPLAEGRERKRQSKRLVYYALSQVSGIRWPWGALGGIRPSYIASEYLQENTPEETRSHLIKNYYLTADKADILVHTTQNEDRILAEVPEDAYAIYIGVPFCPTRCWYCSFTTQEAIGQSHRYGKAYLDKLEEEIEDYLTWYKKVGLNKLHALYVGGGTPADFSEEDFKRFINLIMRLPIEKTTELTVEMGRADVITQEKLLYLKSQGIERICINPQSLEPQVLKHLGRNTRIEQIEEAYNWAKALNFQSINLDFIAGLPHETVESFQNGINLAINWGAQEISVHSLALKRGSELYQKHFTGEDRYSLKPEDDLERMLLDAHTSLLNNSYEPYYLYRHRLGLSGLENISFAKNGHYCVYNVMMMSDRYSIVSFGTPAISKRIDGHDAKRFAQKKSLHLYLEFDEEFLDRKYQHFCQG